MVNFTTIPDDVITGFENLEIWIAEIVRRENVIIQVL